MRRLVALLLMLAGLGVAGPPPADIDGDLTDARRLYAEGQFGAAIVKLQRAIGQLEQMKDVRAHQQQLAGAHLHLALSLIGLDDPGSAKESFKAMLRLDPTRTLDPQVHAPKVIAIYDQARAELAREPAAAAAATKAPQPSPAPAAKKSGSKAPLIALGVGGAAAAGVALAAGGRGGGSSASARPTPTPTPTPTPSGSDDIALLTVAPPTGSTISASQGRPLYTMTFSVVYSRDLPIGALHVELRRDDGTLCSVYEPLFGELFALAAGRAQTISVRDHDPLRCALPSTTATADVVLYPCPSAAPCHCCNQTLINRTFNVRYTFIP